MRAWALMLGCAVVLGVAAPAAALVFTIDHTAEPEPEPPALRFNSFELAWAVATAVPGDHTLRIVTPGPGGVAGGQFFESGYVVPTLALGDSGNITVEAMVPVTLLSDTTLAIFRIASTTGRTLTLTGQPAGAGQLNQRLVLRSGATEPMIDFGDGRGNGALVATDVTLLREAGESDAPWMDLGGEGDTPHVLERVTFSGASTPTLSAPVLVAGRTLGIVNGGTTTPLQARLRGVDFSLAGGTGPRLVLRNRVAFEAVDSQFWAALGQSAPAVVARSVEREPADAGVFEDGGATARFIDCSFISREANLFQSLGLPTHVNVNEYVLERPVFVGGCGPTAFDIADSRARVTVRGTDAGNMPSNERIDLDPMLAGGTARIARLHSGRFALTEATASVVPPGPAHLDSAGAPLLESPVIAVTRCHFTNGAGGYRCGATGGAGAPIVTVENTVYAGGGVPAYLDLSGAHGGAGTATLRHVTMTGATTDTLVRGNPLDILYAPGSLLDGAAPGRVFTDTAEPPNLLVLRQLMGEPTPALAWDGRNRSGLGGAPPSVVVADPMLDAATGRLTRASTAALATATGSAVAFDFEGQARPRPAGAAPTADLGADEADFGPTATAWLNPPAQIDAGATDGTPVGDLTSDDPDPGDTVTYTLIDSAGGRFALRPDGTGIDVADADRVTLAEAPYAVTVSAEDASGLATPTPTPLAIEVGDFRGPRLTGVRVSGPYSIDVAYDEALDAATAEAPPTYLLTGPGAGTLPSRPQAATLIEANTVRLDWSVDSGEMRGGGDVTITFEASITDLWGNAVVPPLSGTDPGGARALAPELASIQLEDARTIRVLFSEAMELATTLRPDAYTLIGDGVGSLTASPDQVSGLNANTFRLIWNSGETAPDARVTVVAAADITDLAGNPLDGAARQASADTEPGDTPPAPTLTGVTRLGDRQLAATFSVPMGPEALAPANYFLDGSGRGTLTTNPDRVALQSGTTYTLTWDAGEQRTGTDNLRLTAINLRSAEGEPIDPQGNRATGDGQGTPPTVVALDYIDLVRLRVRFSEAMDPASAGNPARYTLSGPASTQLDARPEEVTGSGDSWTLRWDGLGLLPGRDITVTVGDVADAAGNPLGTPKAASYRDRIQVTGVRATGQFAWTGDPLVLEAVAAGGAAPLQFTWLKDGDVVGAGRRFEVEALAPEDAGVYTLLVGDGRSEVVQSGGQAVIVRPPLRFIEEPPPVVRVNEGRRAVLAVEVAGGFDERNFEWSRENAEGQFEPVDANIVRDGSRVALVFDPVLPEDGGVYRVAAFDRRGAVVAGPITLEVAARVPAAGTLGVAALAAALALLGARRRR